MNFESEKFSVVVLGEVLFDHFPDGSRTLGGAPFNVAWNLRALGVEPTFISAVGNDSEGTEVLDAMNGWGMSDRGIAVHPSLPTGSVHVTFENNEPTYQIADNQAYDHLSLEPFGNAGKHSPEITGLLYHGSLAMRHPHNRAILETANETTDGLRSNRTFVDLNIRDPWYDPNLLHEIISGATWLKLSQAELARISSQQIEKASIKEIQSAVHRFEANTAEANFTPPTNYLVTCGSQGAFWISNETKCFQPVAPIDDFVDPVGAGDAFAAAAIDGITRSMSPEKILEHAVRFASQACTIRGAITLDREHYYE